MLCSTTLVTTLKVAKIEEDEIFKNIYICVIFDLYTLWRGHGMSSLQTHSNYSVLQLTVSNAVHNPLFDVIRWLEGKWGRVSLLCVVTPMSQDKAGHVALCWAPASSNRLILLLYPVPIPSESLVSKKKFVYAELRTRSYKSQRAITAVENEQTAIVTTASVGCGCPP